MMKKSLWKRIKRLFNWDVVVREVGYDPSRDRETLCHRFRRIRKTAYLEPTGSMDDYNLRFSLADMTEEVWIPVRESEISASFMKIS